MVIRCRSLAALTAIVTLAGGLAACATPASAPTAGTPPTASSAPQPSSCQPDRSGATKTITEADSGTAVCLAVGQRLEVYLHGTLPAKWEPIAIEGQALSSVASGKGALAVGITGGFFIGIAAGNARLTSSRPACPEASTPASPCGSATFVVSVEVR
jgi:hypothetical protein